MLERALQAMRPAHLVALIVGATLMHFWIWSNPADMPNHQARTLLEVGAGLLLAVAWDRLARMLHLLLRRQRRH
jgi:hypothetical protein